MPQFLITFFLGIPPFLYIECYLFVSPFYLTIFVCFYVSYCSVLPAFLCRWTSVVGVLWDSVVQSLSSPYLYALGLPFTQFMLALLFNLNFDF